MNSIQDFSLRFQEALPETHALLMRSGLAVHESVSFVTLHGSRGLGGHPRDDSDIDLGLVVDAGEPSQPSGPLLATLLQTTLGAWRGPVEADLAALFDRTGCGLRCLRTESYRPDLCQPALDCLGVYKLQKGFDGFVPGELLDRSRMYPLMVIWERNPRVRPR